MTGRLYIVGAGLAGLACAVRAAGQGVPVSLFEAADMAGGRCRSFLDSKLNATIDNGSHVVLGGNPAVFEYLDLVGAKDELSPANGTGAIPFFDIKTGARWALKPNQGRIPWFVLFPSRRVPDSKLSDYLAALRLLQAGSEEPVQSVMGDLGPTWERFWEPLSTAIMNTPADQASAALLGAAIKRVLSVKRSGLAAYVPRATLAQTFVDPALTLLSQSGAEIRFASSVMSVEGDTQATRLNFRSASVDLAPNDRLVLAVPPWAPVVRPFLSSTIEASASPIINAHFRLAQPAAGTGDDMTRNGMTGLINGIAHWIFRRDAIVSVTVSADQALADRPHGEIANSLWQDVCRCLALAPTPCPAHRVIVERRATPVQDSVFAGCRPGSQTFLQNVYLAGDWTDTKLPCTLESAIESGFAAAKAALGAG